MIEKGSACVEGEQRSIKVVKERNEIQEYLDCRYLSACEAMWRILAFHIHKRKPALQKLIINDMEWRKVMAEAAEWALSSQLRHLFVLLLL